MFRKIEAIMELCRFDRPLLAIPFAGTAAYLFSGDDIPDFQRLALLFIALFAAFGAGGAMNGLTDLRIDKVNPRTIGRPLAAGRLTKREAVAVGVVGIATMVAATYALDPRLLLLLPIPAGLALFYSLTKRFTWGCHFFLATVNAGCPVGAWLVFNGFNPHDIRGVLLGAVVFFWTVGFELIYSSQDAQYDVAMGMNSIPAHFGIRRAYQISKACHATMTVLLAALLFIVRPGIPFYVALACAYVVLLYEHSMVAHDNVARAGETFDWNEVFSCLVFLGAVADKWRLIKWG